METATINVEPLAWSPPLTRVVVDELDGVGEKIKIALDGRAQRWLSARTMIAESDLSKKMSGKQLFTLAELRSIAGALNIEFIIAPPPKKPPISN